MHKTLVRRHLQSRVRGITSRAIYAYACAGHMPGRITGIVNCAGCIPNMSRAQFKRMDSSSRVTIYVARYTPQLLSILMRAMLTNIDAGYDQEFVQDLYEKPPFDLQTLEDLETK